MDTGNLNADRKVEGMPLNAGLVMLGVMVVGTAGRTETEDNILIMAPYRAGTKVCTRFTTCGGHGRTCNRR